MNKPVNKKNIFVNVINTSIEIVINNVIVKIVELPKCEALIYVSGNAPIGSGARNAELLNIKGRTLKLKCLGKICSVRLDAIRICKLLGGIELHVVNNYVYLLYKNGSAVNIGNIQEDYLNSMPCAYIDIGMINTNLKKVKMKPESMKTIEDVKAICPIITIMDGDKRSGESLYLVALNGFNILGYNINGELKYIKSKPGEVLNAHNSSGLSVTRSGAKIIVKNLVTGRNRVLGFSDFAIDFELEFDNLKRNLPKQVTVDSELNDTVVNIVEKKETKKMSNAENTTPADPDAPVAPAVATAANKILNPPDVTGRPRRGRPPAGWLAKTVVERKAEVANMVKAGKITQDAADTYYKLL